MFDIIIVGAGTAGLSAAIYALRAGKSVLVLERENYGGQIVSTPEVENYPGIKKISGFEFATGLYEQAVELGMEIKYAKVTSLREKTKETENKKEIESEIDCDLEAASQEDKKKIFDVETSEGSFSGNSLILATGVTKRSLNIDREKEFIGKGLSYCATCDGAFFKGKDVAVVGGGNSALEEAFFLSNYCRKVYIIHRREELRGEARRWNLLKEKENVSFVLNCEVKELQGENCIEKILLWDKKEQKEQALSVEGVFVAIGQVPDNEVFQDVLELDEQGYLLAGEDCHTSARGIFAAGDCRSKKIRQLTTAAADGAVAALAACEYTADSNFAHR